MYSIVPSSGPTRATERRRSSRAANSVLFFNLQTVVSHATSTHKISLRPPTPTLFRGFSLASTVRPCLFCSRSLQIGRQRDAVKEGGTGGERQKISPNRCAANVAQTHRQTKVYPYLLSSLFFVLLYKPGSCSHDALAHSKSSLHLPDLLNHFPPRRGTGPRFKVHSVNADQ